MKRLLTFALTLLAMSAVVRAAEPVIVDLTPADAVGDEKNILELYIPAGELHGTVLMCPGGGYGALATDREGRRWAPWFAERGYATAVLLYRLPHHHSNIPFDDCAAAMSYLRGHAGELGIPADRIGIMGSSAGGHLAAYSSVVYKPGNRPDFTILFYPVISMQDDITNIITRRNLFTPEQLESAQAKDFYSAENKVNANTPPTFLVMCQNDDIVNIDNSIRYYQALTASGVPAEMHIFPPTKDPHGFGFNLGFTYRSEILSLLSRWLSEQNK